MGDRVLEGGIRTASRETSSDLQLLVTEATEPRLNLALEDELLLAVESGAQPETLRLWVNDECLVRGRRRTAGTGWHHSHVARRLGVRVRRRSTGGGSVYHDRGNLNWSFYLRRTAGYVGPARLFRVCAEVIIAGLEDLGIAASFALPNRIDVAGRKVSGLASRATLGAVLIHGTLLVSTDLERLNAVCIPPPDCPPVARLCDFAPGVTIADVTRCLAARPARLTCA